MPTRSARRAPLLTVLLALAGCTTAVTGTAVPVDQAGRPADKPSIPGMELRQQASDKPPNKFGGTTAYDACTILPIDVVAQAGFAFNLDTGSRAVLNSARLTENAEDDPHGRGSTSDHGLSQCQYPGKGSLLLTFTIHQAPFDSPGTQADYEKAMRANGAKDGESAGFRTLYRSSAEAIRSESTTIFGQDFWATLDLLPGTEPVTLGPALVKAAAERLHAPPTGPATYSYDGDFAHLRPPCEIFTSEDFKQALGFGTDGRPVESYGFARSHTIPDAGSGTSGHTETTEMLTSCKQENQAAANSGVDSTPPQGITLEFTNYLTPEMAAQENDYNCAEGKGYQHPYGEPKKVPIQVGDGLTCLINMGSVQSPLTFKSGRTSVQMSVFSVAGLKDDATAIRVYTSVAKAVAARLAS